MACRVAINTCRIAVKRPYSVNALAARGNDAARRVATSFGKLGALDLNPRGYKRGREPRQGENARRPLRKARAGSILYRVGFLFFRQIGLNQAIPFLEDGSDVACRVGYMVVVEDL